MGRIKRCTCPSVCPSRASDFLEKNIAAETSSLVET